jgi:hypothetical protein
MFEAIYVSSPEVDAELVGLQAVNTQGSLNVSDQHHYLIISRHDVMFGM